jgi:ribosomal protein L40E
MMIRMVYCFKCGNLNSDDAIVCNQCGMTLRDSPKQTNAHWAQRQTDGSYNRRGGSRATLFFGIIIIVAGLAVLLSELYGFAIPWWPIILIFVGLWLLIAGIRRSRKITPQQT